MLKKYVLVLTLVILVGGPMFAAKNTSQPAAEEEAGYAMLTSLVGSFTSLAQAGTGGYELVNEMIQERMQELKKARQQEQVDPIFFRRYHKMLVAIKLVIMDLDYDSEGILNDHVGDFLSAYIYEISGERPELPPREHRGLGAVAGAIAEEILNLHLYLEGKKDRAALMEKYMQWSSPKKK